MSRVAVAAAAGKDEMADRRRPCEVELLDRAMECFVGAGARVREHLHDESGSWHCCVEEVPGRWYWQVQLPGDAISFGGDSVPLWTTISPCDAHLPEFERMWPE